MGLCKLRSGWSIPKKKKNPDLFPSISKFFFLGGKKLLKKNGERNNKFEKYSDLEYFQEEKSIEEYELLMNWQVPVTDSQFSLPAGFFIFERHRNINYRKDENLVTPGFHYLNWQYFCHVKTSLF